METVRGHLHLRHYVGDCDGDYEVGPRLAAGIPGSGSVKRRPPPPGRRRHRGVLHLDNNHPHTLITRGNLEYCLGEAGQLVEALTRCQQLLEDRTRVLGPDHPDTVATRRRADLLIARTTRK